MTAAASLSAWQPRYAEHGIALFPVVIQPDGRKVPAVTNYARAGLRASAAWASGKFAEAPTFGFDVAKAGLTIVDIDTPDERVLADAVARHGETPLVVRSGSGNHQLWYRSSGERRRIRPDRALPIDLLGAGGYVIAPPSRGTRGPYQIIKGSLDDLEALPPVRASVGRDADAGRAAPLITAGRRNTMLWFFAMANAPYCDEFADLLDAVRTFVAQGIDQEGGHAFTDEEAEAAAASAWKYTLEGRNWIGASRIVITREVSKRMRVEQPDALLLLLALKEQHNPGHEFAVANGMAESMGWTRKRFAAARQHLETEGFLTMQRPATRHTGPAVYKLKGGQN